MISRPKTKPFVVDGGQELALERRGRSSGRSYRRSFDSEPLQVGAQRLLRLGRLAALRSTSRMNTSSSRTRASSIARRRDGVRRSRAWRRPGRCRRRSCTAAVRRRLASSRTPGTPRSTERSAAASSGSNWMTPRSYWRRSPAIGSSSTLRPRWIITMCWQSSSACAMTCVENRIVAPRRCSSAITLLEQADADRVEAAERLVEDQQIRLVDDRGHERRALQHPLREVLAALLARRRRGRRAPAARVRARRGLVARRRP